MASQADGLQAVEAMLKSMTDFWDQVPDEPIPETVAAAIQAITSARDALLPGATPTTKANEA